MDKIYLIRGNDTPLSVCLRKSEGEGDPVPYDLSTAERMRLALVGHGMHVFAEDIEISGEDNNIISGVIPGRSLLKGDYDLEVTFNLDGRDKRFAIKDMFEAVDFLAEDADGEAEGEGAGIFVTVTVQPELIEISGPTGPQGKSAYQVWLDDGHTGTEDDFFEWLAAQTPNPDWNQNDSTKADFIKNRTHWEEESITTIPDAKLAWSGSTPEDLDFWFLGTDVHIPRTSAGWGLTWEGGELFIDDIGSGYEIGVFDGEEWSYNPFDPSYDPQPYPLNVDVVIASETVHKLPNKFLDMDTEPTTGSGKPVTSGGVKAAIADFVTRAVNDLLNYYTKTETYTKAEVNQLVAGINNWEIVPVAQLPEASADTMHKIYLVPSSNPKTKNVKDEFITVEVSGAYSWEQIGTTAIDLTNYVTSTAFTQALATKQDKIDAQHKLDYSLLDNTPEIPDPSDFATKEEVSQLRSEVDGKLDAYEIVSELPINATVDGWYLKGDGYTTTNTSYRIRKYQVTSGMSLYLRLSKDSPGVYQFQDQASVPTSGTLHVIGEPVTTATDGVVTVPQGATYLIVSLLKTNTSNEVNIVNTYDEKVISEIAISSNSSRLFNNRYIDNNAAIIGDKDWVISPKIKCSQGALIKWKSGYANTSIYISIVAFNSAGEKLGYYSVGATQQEYRSFTADWSGIAYVIASFYKGNTGGYLEIDGVRLIEITAQTLLSLDDQPITVLDNDVIANNISKEPSVVSCASLLGTDSFKVAGKLTLLWLSDIHGNATNLSRIVRYGKYHSQLFSDIIHTGDSVLSTISNADPFQSVNGAEKILNVIGNHEAWLSSSDTDYNATEKQTYDKIFAPNIANWDVVQPANAADNGYCYYYKDYTTEKFRLIVLDSVHWHYRNGVAQQNAAQKSWFESALADAKTQGLTVICATHYTPQNGINPVPNTGFNLLGATAGGNIADGWYASDEMFGCVDDFVINGGKFAGWIVGHTHTDYIGTVFNHNSQPIVIMGTSGTTSRNNKFLAGTSSQDNFDVITFEVLSNKSIVKVVKLGQDTDIYLRSKKTICYDFTDSNLISTT